MKPFVEKLSVAAVGLLAGCYLLNIGMGWIELLPDNLPLVGNLDEAAATTILLGALAYFGLDLSKLFRGAERRRPAGERPVKGKVIE